MLKDVRYRMKNRRRQTMANGEWEMGMKEEESRRTITDYVIRFDYNPNKSISGWRRRPIKGQRFSRKEGEGGRKKMDEEEKAKKE